MRILGFFATVINLMLFATITYAQKPIERLDSICNGINLNVGFRDIGMKGILGNEMSTSATFYLVDTVHKEIRKATFMQKGKVLTNFYYENNQLIKVDKTTGINTSFKVLGSYYFKDRMLIYKNGRHKKFADVNTLVLQSESILTDSNMVQYFLMCGIILN